MNQIITKYNGIVPYEKSMELQKEIHSSVANGGPDHLLLLQHDHVITMGRTANPNDILVEPNVLENLNISVHQTDRGGEVTYHGPGQLIGYPIINLRKHELGPLDYLEILKTSLSVVLNAHGLASKFKDVPTGVWVNDSKIASLGIKVSQGVTLHGFALNVNTDLDFFDYIIPCGLPEAKSTSMKKELGHSVCMTTISEKITHHLAKSLKLEVVPSRIKTGGPTIN
jgi:lipoate-protein ligase B